MSDVLDRFLRYARVNTQSDEAACDRVPSTAGQRDLARLLARELEALGAQNVQADEHAYVRAWIPASPGCAHLPRLGLIAHLDTAAEAPGAGVAPRVTTYEGGALVAGTVDGKPVALSPEDLPALNELTGEQIVVTDGTTLLGADDKAGIAEIMALVARLAENPALPHPPLGVCFVPDEEIGHGAALLDIDAFGCAYAYTVDGGPLGELQWECFNAAEATLRLRGRTTHPGDAKGRMVNAVHLFEEFEGMLPAHERPEHTAGYEGFIHCQSVSATCEHATARYIVRDHDAARFQRKINLMQAAAAYVNLNHGAGTATLDVRPQYRNMAEAVRNHPELISRAAQAFTDAGVAPRVIPVRGGTDGAQLSLRGLPCPNLSTGGYCMHSVSEFVPVRSLETMVDVLQALVARFATEEEHRAPHGGRGGNAASA